MAEDTADEGRFDWRIALGATALGGGAIAYGVYFASNRTDAVSGLLIEIGAAIGLVAVLAFLERRLISRTRKTAETAARTAAREVTDAIQDRLVRLEEVDEAQA